MPIKTIREQIECANGECANPWRKIFALLTLILAELLAGLNVEILDLFAGGKVSLLVLSFLRDTIAAITTALLAKALSLGSGGQPWRPLGQELPAFILLGGLLWGNQTGKAVGSSLASGPLASFFQQVVPILTATLASVFKQERPPSISTAAGQAKLGGLLLASGGALTMVLSKGIGGFNGVSGPIVLSLQCIDVAFYFVLQHRFVFSPAPTHELARSRTQKGVLRRWATATIYMVSMCYCVSGAFSALAVLSQLAVSRDISSLRVPAEAWISILYAAFVGSSFVFAALAFANKHLAPSATIAMTALQPISAALLNSYIRRVGITKAEMASSAVIVLGVGCLIRAKFLEEPQKQEQQPSTNEEQLLVPTHEEQAA